MTLLNFSFSARQFSALSEAERLFFVRLANLANDLRYVRLLTVTAVAATNRHEGAEQEVVLHQMIFGLRQWYAILDAGWEVVRSGWNSDQLGKKLYPLLSKGRTAYDELKNTSAVQTSSRTFGITLLRITKSGFCREFPS